MSDAANAPLILHDSEVEDDHVSEHGSERLVGIQESELLRPSLFVWVLTFIAGISGVLFGYDTGVISSTLVSIHSDLSGHELTAWNKSFITSSTPLFALIASPITGILADKIGRKNVILAADVLFIGAALWQALTNSLWGIIVGRSIVGLAIGAASLIVPLYISELSPSPFRGRLVTLSILLVTVGQVIAYITGWLLSTKSNGWRWMVGIGGIPAVFQFMMMLFLPETPRYLVKTGKVEKARNVLDRVYGRAQLLHNLVDGVLHSIEGEIEEEVKAKRRRSVRSAPSKYRTSYVARIFGGRWTELFQVPGNRRALIIACLLQGLQQLCGFNSLMYFSATLFSLLAFDNPTLPAISIAVTNLLFTILALVLIDRIGRRRILLRSIPLMIFGLILCSAAFLFFSLPAHPDDDEASRIPNDEADPDPRLWPMIIVAAMIVYVAGYALGLGNVPWQQSELFPLSVRSLGSSLSTATNWGSNFIVGMTFLPMMDALTPSVTFGIYALICAFGWFAVQRIYPETRRLSLEEVSGLLKNGWGVKESLLRDSSTR